MSIDILITIIGSAGVASIVSGLFLLVNDHLKRVSEEKRLKMEIALKLTKMKDEQVGEIVKRTPAGTKITVTWLDPSDNLKEYLKRIKKLWNEI